MYKFSYKSHKYCNKNKETKSKKLKLVQQKTQSAILFADWKSLRYRD